MIPEGTSNDQFAIANKLLASFASMLMYWYHFVESGKRIEVETKDEGIAKHFLHLLSQKEPNELAISSLNASMILYAEHEFNASTFAARVTASTLSDFYSAITSGIGTTARQSPWRSQRSSDGID